MDKKKQQMELERFTQVHARLNEVFMELFETLSKRKGTSIKKDLADQMIRVCHDMVEEGKLVIELLKETPTETKEEVTPVKRTTRKPKVVTEKEKIPVKRKTTKSASTVEKPAIEKPAVGKPVAKKAQSKPAARKASTAKTDTAKAPEINQAIKTIAKSAAKKTPAKKVTKK